MMNELLSSLTVADLLAFCGWFFAGLIAIIKGCDYLNNRFHLFKTGASENRETLQKTLQQVEEINEQVHHNREELLILLESDKNRTRSEIVKAYSHFSEVGYIDWKSLDYLQQQYTAYKAEGGNSYVHDLMNRLEHLPVKN